MRTTIALTVVVPDDLTDSEDATGLTNDGYEALMLALTDEGFEIASGPRQVTS